jgi:hypothetical protein
MGGDGKVAPLPESIELFGIRLVVAQMEKKIRGAPSEASPELLYREVIDGGGSLLTAGEGKKRENG